MRRHRWLVRAFPPAWRARYDDELDDLLADMASEGPIPFRDRLDLATAGASERLRRLPGSVAAQRRAVLPACLVLGVAAAVGLTAVRTSIPTGSAQPLRQSARPIDRSATPGASSWPHDSSRTATSPPAEWGTGELHFPGPSRLTMHRAGMVTTYQGTCSASGACTLSPLTGPADGTVTVTLDPITGAILAIGGTRLPAGTTSGPGTAFGSSTTAP